MTLNLQGLPPEKLDEVPGVARQELDASRVSISVPNHPAQAGNTFL